jgi:hypothetical protein
VPEKLKPGPGRMIVEPLGLSEEYKLDDGTLLYLPHGTGKDDALICKVVGVYDKPYAENGMLIDGSEYALGTMVVIGKYTGTRLILNRKEVIVVPIHSVVAELVSEPEEPSGPIQQSNDSVGATAGG